MHLGQITAMKSTIVLILAISGLVISCSTKELPKDLNESIAYFEKHWSSGQLRDFKDKDEKKAVTELHMSVGMWIRNNWIHGDRNPKLIKFFDSLNFRHPDDISSTILTSLHRKLNNRDIDLPGLIAYYEAYWKPIIECEENHRSKILEWNNLFDVGDTLKIIFPVDVLSNGDRNAVGYGCPNREWVFDLEKDLRVDALVTKKFNLHPKNPFVNVKILKMNFEHTKIYLRDVHVGDTVEYALSTLEIKFD
jgi:hypothetical protein